MRDRPIPFSPPMVRALLAGRKTVTRRVITHFDGTTYARDPSRVTEWKQHSEKLDPSRKWWAYEGGASSLPLYGRRSPFGEPGDRLWVKETFSMQERIMSLRPSPIYAADEAEVAANRLPDGSMPWRWTPSIHMPRIASRILLTVTHVWIERLHEITEAEARAEGIDEEDHEPPPEPDWRFDPVAAYRQLWDKLNAPRRFGWDRNPWVWVVHFRVLASKNGPAPV